MATIDTILKEKVLLLDGAMGTQIFEYSPTVDDFGGAQFEGCVELLNVNRPEWIQKIHENYFNAGSDAVETNTFGGAELILGEFGIPERSFELNVKAVELAKEVARSFTDRPRFVIGSVGPGTKILTLGHVTYDKLFKSYYTQMRGLIVGGADAILIETCQDIGQVKCAVRAAKKAMAAEKKKVPIWVQVTIETTGTMLVGSDILTALTAIEALGVDVLGMNCATGPGEMEQHLAVLSKHASANLSCLPNAGLPENKDGKVHYPLGPELFAEKVSKLASQYGLNITGGCCGTTPEHIKALSSIVGNLTPKKRAIEPEKALTSLYQPFSLNTAPPILIGERTNANGSKKFREALLAGDSETMLQMAKDQVKEGAHLLDVCVAYVGRNEEEDMEKFLQKVVTQVNLPLVIDSTEPNVLEKALQVAPGRCLVNSINFEDGEEKARKILSYCREYGAAVIGLTIDEEGMAKTAEKKLAIAERLVALVKEYGLTEEELFVDPLTFTLASGDEEFRKAGIETLNAIAMIQEKFPKIKTLLGLSNISFGLKPATRKFLNSIFLHEALKKGLTSAIVHASQIVPISKIPEDERQFFYDLVYDARKEGYDPLKEILALTTVAAKAETERDDAPIDELLKNDVIDGRKQKVAEHCMRAMEEGHKPLDIINNYLLDGMKVVGERFGAGEMQLPFVLESAETMKLAVKTLEPYMEKKSSDYSKGSLLLATVKGDVHDIGKNLVDIILTNNGFTVKNIGIKQPIETIYSEFEKEPLTAIGLSGLLVKSTVIMKENLQFLEEKKLDVPVILGGAALTRAYVENDCQKVYSAPVFYSEDAFEGLRILSALGQKPWREIDIQALRGSNPSSGKKIEIIRKGGKSLPLDEYKQSSFVRKLSESELPKVTKGVFDDKVTVEELFGWLDEFALIRSRWGFQKGKNQSDEAFEEILQTKAYPALKTWKERIISDRLLEPKGRYGFFEAMSEENTIRFSHGGEKFSIEFPRQEATRRLCIADFISPKLKDTLALQIVTIGHKASEITKELYDRGDFTDYLYFHSLSTELTEAYAEYLHAKIRNLMGISAKDSQNRRQLFSQGYQGSRYSFGYPACPDMAGNAVIIDALKAEELGILLSQETLQMVPEQSTSALVIHHPQARYFST